MEVAEVVESRRADLAEGTLVAAAYGHRSCHVVVPGDVVVAVPADVVPILGIYLAQMGPICANGLLQAAGEFAGSGATSPADAAMGIDVIDERDAEPWAWCKDRWIHGRGDTGLDVVFQCRGRASLRHQVLRSLRPQGVVIDLAFYQGGAPELRLGEEFHHNGLTIRCAQIARVPRGLAAAWDRRRLAEETARLLAGRGDVVRRHLISEVVAVEAAPPLLCALARREQAARQIVLTFAD